LPRRILAKILAILAKIESILAKIFCRPIAEALCLDSRSVSVLMQGLLPEVFKRQMQEACPWWGEGFRMSGRPSCHIGPKMGGKVQKDGKMLG
jgi:hypothetical protein